jgi:hypothetical protein
MTSKSFRIKRFRETRLILLDGLLSHLRQKVRRSREQIIPPTLRFQFSEDPRADRFLLGLW